MTGTIIGWHLGYVGPQLAAALPGWRYVAAPSPSATLPPSSGPAVLVGYSAGCVGVRGAIGPLGDRVRAVVTIDGTHSQIGPGAKVHPAHLAIWRPLAERARRGEVLWVATTLGQHRYTERLGAQAYASTGRVLEAALGLADGALREPQAIDDGGLHVRSYPSRDMDADAHARQVREALPAMWAEVVVPHVTGARDPQPTIGDDDPTDPGADTDPAPPPEPHGHELPPRGLGLRALDVAREHLERGVREVPGPGSDAQVLAYHYPVRRGGTPVAGILDATGARLGLADDAVAWCASFASFCLSLAIERGLEAAPHGYRCSVAELVADARALGTWRERGYRPAPGDLAIWTRAGGDPRVGGTGHVARVEGYDPASDRVTCIDGNSADAVRRTVHDASEPTLVGWVAY